MPDKKNEANHKFDMNILKKGQKENIFKDSPEKPNKKNKKGKVGRPKKSEDEKTSTNMVAVYFSNIEINKLGKASEEFLEKPVISSVIRLLLKKHGYI
jgi:hypothetical protein